MHSCHFCRSCFPPWKCIILLLFFNETKEKKSKCEELGNLCQPEITPLFTNYSWHKWQEWAKHEQNLLRKEGSCLLFRIMLRYKGQLFIQDNQKLLHKWQQLQSGLAEIFRKWMLTSMLRAFTLWSWEREVKHTQSKLDTQMRKNRIRYLPLALPAS